MAQPAGRDPAGRADLADHRTGLPAQGDRPWQAPSGDRGAGRSRAQGGLGPLVPADGGRHAVGSGGDVGAGRAAAAGAGPGGQGPGGGAGVGSGLALGARVRGRRAAVGTAATAGALDAEGTRSGGREPDGDGGGPDRDPDAADHSGGGPARGRDHRAGWGADPPDPADGWPRQVSDQLAGAAAGALPAAAGRSGAGGRGRPQRPARVRGDDWPAAPA